MSQWFKETDDDIKAKKFSKFANNRKYKIQTQFWSDEQGFFCDINHATNTHSHVLSLAGTTPLFLKISTTKQAKQVADTVENNFLTEHGLITTLCHTSQQWDAPNGWAPLHWQTVIGLRNYGFDELAKTIATRFLNTVNNEYNKTGKIREKFNVCDTRSRAGGGEYEVQDGFGWTNGVVLAFISMYNL